MRKIIASAEQVNKNKVKTAQTAQPTYKITNQKQ